MNLSELTSVLGVYSGVSILLRLLGFNCFQALKVLIISRPHSLRIKTFIQKIKNQMLNKIFKILLILGIAGFGLAAIGWYTVRYSLRHIK